jgi:hypothetical protein
MWGFDKKAPSPLRSAGALQIDRFQSKALVDTRLLHLRQPRLLTHPGPIGGSWN